MSSKLPLISFAIIVLAVVSSAAQEVTLEPIADTHVATVLDSRRNDNWGCDPILGIAGSRGGGGIPFGGPDANRTLILFDLSSLSEPVGLATLELSLSNFLADIPQTHVVDIHRILEPWIEGNGNESPPHPSGCEWVDPAYGVAWVGAGDGGDANNQTQPSFDPFIWSSLTFLESESSGAGQVYSWDVTTLVNAWISGDVPNYGMLLRDITSDGVNWKAVGFGSREMEFNDYPGLLWPVVPGPKLQVFGSVAVHQSSWGRVKALYRH